MNFKTRIAYSIILSAFATNMHASASASSNTVATSSLTSVSKVYQAVPMHNLGALRWILGSAATTERWVQGGTLEELKQTGWTQGHTEFNVRELAAYPCNDNSAHKTFYRLGLCLGTSEKGVKIQLGSHYRKAAYFKPELLYKMPLTESNE